MAASLIPIRPQGVSKGIDLGITQPGARAGRADSGEGGRVKREPSAVLTASVYSIISEHGDELSEGNDELGK